MLDCFSMQAPSSDFFLKRREEEQEQTPASLAACALGGNKHSFRTPDEGVTDDRKDKPCSVPPFVRWSFFQAISKLQNKNCFSIKTRFTNGYEGSIWMICIKVKQGLKKKKHATSYLLVCKCNDGQKMSSRTSFFSWFKAVCSVQGLNKAAFSIFVFLGSVSFRFLH